MTESPSVARARDGARALMRRSQGDRPRIMGILNLTPDSFYDGGTDPGPDDAVSRGMEMARQGADLLDLGAESTRPGAVEVPVQEELDRLLPVLEHLAPRIGIPISVDTRKARVAEAALAAGASLVNDVSGLRHDPAMPALVAAAGCPVVLMHMRGTPASMQSLARYDDVVDEVVQELDACVKEALAAGIESENLILDPGIGFAKTPEQSFRLLAGLPRLHELGYPLLVGVSRKSFIYRTLGLDPHRALPGTLAALAACTLAGVAILRVHDVAPALQAVQIAHRLREA